MILKLLKKFSSKEKQLTHTNKIDIQLDQLALHYKHIFTQEDINRMYKKLVSSNITDQHIRAKHIQMLNNDSEHSI